MFLQAYHPPETYFMAIAVGADWISQAEGMQQGCTPLLARRPNLSSGPMSFINMTD